MAQQQLTAERVARMCEARTGFEAGPFGEQPIHCRQVVGIRRFEGADGTEHGYCGLADHREQVMRRFGRVAS